MIAGIRNRSWEEQNGDAVDADESGTDINNDALFVDESSAKRRSNLSMPAVWEEILAKGRKSFHLN